MEIIDFFIAFLVSFLIFAIVLYLIRRFWPKVVKYRPKYPSKYLCLDGHYARSLSEVVVDNCLHINGIHHDSEGEILKKNSENRKFKFDWYLPDSDIYIEFFGFSGKKYHKNRKEKEKFYKRHRLKMITLEPEDLANIEKSLKNKLGKIWKSKNEGRFCPNCGEKFDRRIINK